jgi:lambda repressor-like predicted transcriptional regulator
MSIANMHPEDIKAALRKRFGTIVNFERAKDLPHQSVTDVLRGRPNARVSQAIEEALESPPPAGPQSSFTDCSDKDDGAHRLISAAR